MKSPYEETSKGLLKSFEHLIVASKPYGSGTWSGWEFIYSRARKERDSGIQNY
jgi:hypothetical protein